MRSLHARGARTSAALVALLWITDAHARADPATRAVEDPAHVARVAIGLAGAGGLPGGWEVPVEETPEGEILVPEQVTGRRMRLIGPRRLERRVARYREPRIEQPRSG